MVTAFVSVPSGFAIKPSPGRERVRSSSVARTSVALRWMATPATASPAPPTADHFNAVRNRVVLSTKEKKTAIPVPVLSQANAAESIGTVDWRAEIPAMRTENTAGFPAMRRRCAGFPAIDIGIAIGWLDPVRGDVEVSRPLISILAAEEHG